MVAETASTEAPASWCAFRGPITPANVRPNVRPYEAAKIAMTNRMKYSMFIGKLNVELNV
jgi:hypothetical protein